MMRVGLGDGEGLECGAWGPERPRVLSFYICKMGPTTPGPVAESSESGFIVNAIRNCSLL